MVLGILFLSNIKIVILYFNLKVYYKMINIYNNSTQVEVYFPRNERKFTPNLLKVRSVVKNIDYDYLVTCTIEGDYFKCTLDLSDLTNGEYKYTLTNGLDCTYGLIRIGDPKPSTVKNNTTITYKPYGE